MITQGENGSEVEVTVLGKGVEITGRSMSSPPRHDVSGPAFHVQLSISASWLLCSALLARMTKADARKLLRHYDP